MFFTFLILSLATAHVESAGRFGKSTPCVFTPLNLTKFRNSIDKYFYSDLETHFLGFNFTFVNVSDANFLHRISRKRWFRAENQGSALLYFAYKYGDESFRYFLDISYDTIHVELTVTPPECYSNSVEDVESSFVKDYLLTGFNKTDNIEDQTYNKTSVQICQTKLDEDDTLIWDEISCCGYNHKTIYTCLKIGENKYMPPFIGLSVTLSVILYLWFLFWRLKGSRSKECTNVLGLNFSPNDISVVQENQRTVIDIFTVKTSKIMIAGGPIEDSIFQLIKQYIKMHIFKRLRKDEAKFDCKCFCKCLLILFHFILKRSVYYLPIYLDFFKTQNRKMFYFFLPAVFLEIVLKLLLRFCGKVNAEGKNFSKKLNEVINKCNNWARFKEIIKCNCKTNNEITNESSENGRKKQKKCKSTCLSILVIVYYLLRESIIVLSFYNSARFATLLIVKLLMDFDLTSKYIPLTLVGIFYLNDKCKIIKNKYRVFNQKIIDVLNERIDKNGIQFQKAEDENTMVGYILNSETGADNQQRVESIKKHVMIFVDHQGIVSISKIFIFRCWDMMDNRGSPGYLLWQCLLALWDVIVIAIGLAYIFILLVICDRIYFMTPENQLLIITASAFSPLMIKCFVASAPVPHPVNTSPSRFYEGLLSVIKSFNQDWYKVPQPKANEEAPFINSTESNH
ncbi:uncharacterized protein LOC131940225 [Physella acuta]|uniref:uncharacterized protein LOC131940225 n=1 Tax=Physella acuta TaxID=109671 RepID=UPI0027DB0957|nr:uncharacterized protein LOC131940225 [Physella acuta]